MLERLGLVRVAKESEERYREADAILTDARAELNDAARRRRAQAEEDATYRRAAR